MFLRKHLLMLAFTLTLILFGCSDDGDDNPTNGNPSDYEADATANTSEGGLKYMYGASSYDEDDDETFIFLASNESLFIDQAFLSDCVVINFDGQGTGSHSIDEENLNILIGSKIYVCESGTLNITEYGPIGGTVSGNLSAELSGLTGGNLTVSNLSFSVRRFDDDDFDDDDYEDDFDDDNGDDNDDDNLKNFTLNVKDAVTGESISFNYANVGSTTLSYLNIGTKALSFSIEGTTSDNKVLLLSGTITGIQYGTKEYEITQQNGAVWLNYDNNAYIMDSGIIKIDNWEEPGDYMKLMFEGTLNAAIDEYNDLEIMNLSFELRRDS